VWQYRRAVCTGLGDRLGAMLTLAALAHVSRATVEVEWCVRAPPDVVRRIRSGIPAWDGYNYSLAEFQGAFATPPGVRFVARLAEPGGPAVSYQGNRLPSEEGRDQLYTLAWMTTRLRDPVPRADFERAYRIAGAALQALRPPLPAAVWGGGPYVVVHVRAMDGNTPEFYRRPQAQFCTRRVVGRLAEGGLGVVLMSNDARWAAGDLGGAGGARVRVSEGTAYEDMATLLSADGVVQHCATYSSFSSVPAMAHGIPLINTYSGGAHRYGLFLEAGELPSEFHTCDDEERFVEAVLWRARNRY
jgi:hypothetical protein